MPRHTFFLRLALSLVFFVLAVSLVAPQASAAPVPTGSQTYHVPPPTGSSPGKIQGKVQTLTINVAFPDPADNTKTKTVAVPVPGIAPFDAKTETPAAASKRKADAIKGAFDAAAKAGTIPNTVTTTIEKAKVPVWDGTLMPNPFYHVHPPAYPHPPVTHTLFNHTTPKIPDNSKTKLVENGMSAVKWDGVTKSAIIYQPDPTFQAGGTGNFTPGKGPTPSPSPSYRPSTSGSTGSTMGISSGLDPLGEQSLITFGFYNDEGGTNLEPKMYLTALQPIAGQTEDELMEQLVGLFNFQYGPSYSLQFDEDTRTVFLNQELDWSNTFWFGNSDDGLDLVFAMTPVPEPSTLALAVVSLVCLGAWSMRRVGT